MPSHNKIFSLLERVAEASDHTRHQMAAALVIRNDIIAFGWNRMKSDPMQAKYGANKDCIYLHAEIHAIKNALRTRHPDQLARADIFVLRKKEQKYGLAKPCAGCMRAISEFNIRNVYYTTEEGYEVI